MPNEEIYSKTLTPPAPEPKPEPKPAPKPAPKPKAENPKPTPKPKKPKREIRLTKKQILWIVVCGAVLLTIGLIVLFAVLFHWTWAVWQWFVGIGACLVITPPLFLLVRYLDEEEIVDMYGSTYILFIVLLGINLLFAFIFSSAYEIIYTCISLLCLIGSITMEHIASQDTDGESWVKYYKYETIGNVVLAFVVFWLT